MFACADADPSAGVEGVTVVITDGTGTEVTRLTTNAAGNFYTGMTMPATIHASLEQGTTKQAMITAQSTGACNSCHTVPSVNGAPGRLYISQAACGGATTDLAQDSATGN